MKVDEICEGDGAKVCVLKQYTNTLNYDQLKPGGSIPAKGKKISVNIKSVKDLTRDVIKVIFRGFPSETETSVRGVMPTDVLCM